MKSTMKKLSSTVGVIAVALSLSSFLSAQESSTARAIVTADTKSNESAVTVPRQTISVLENRKPQEVTGWVPLRGERSGLQLVVLLDDSARSNLGLQLDDLRKFITGLPANAEVAVGYMRNGTPNLVQTFTTDHNQAAQSLRLPNGTAGGNGSPYFCLSDLVKHWPGGNANVRREVVMITDGVDRYSGGRFDPEDPYVQAATSDAQKAGVVVYSIYYRDAGAYDRSRLVADGGQNYLTQISAATGGKVYLEGFGNPVSFAPFLSDIQHKLQNQYELTFASNSKPGLQPIQVKTNQPNTKLAWPARVPVGGVTPSP
jgi:VWFA-related protein